MKISRSSIAKCLMITLLLARTANAGLPSYIYDSSPDSFFKLEERQDIAYSPELAMKGTILSFKRQNKTNHFCVLGLLWNNGRYELPVFWMEKKILFKWKGASNEDKGEDIVLTIRMAKSIDYEKSVVDTREEIGFSTYLELRSNVQDLLRDCQKYGDKFIIKPFKRPKKCGGYGDVCEDPLGWVL